MGNQVARTGSSNSAQSRRRRMFSPARQRTTSSPTSAQRGSSPSDSARTHAARKRRGRSSASPCNTGQKRAAESGAYLCSDFADHLHLIRPAGRQQTVAEVVGLTRIDRQQGQGDVQALGVAEVRLRPRFAQQRIGPAAVRSQVMDHLRHVGRLGGQQRVHQRPRPQCSERPPAAERQECQGEREQGAANGVIAAGLPHHLLLRRRPVLLAGEQADVGPFPPGRQVAVFRLVAPGGGALGQAQLGPAAARSRCLRVSQSRSEGTR